MATFANTDQFFPWNTWWESADPMAPWNSRRWRNDPSAPWNLAACSDAYAEAWYRGHQIGGPYGPPCLESSERTETARPRAVRSPRTLTRWDLEA